MKRNLTHTAAKERRANFDRVARIYRWAEYLCLGPLLQRTRTHLVPRLSEVQNALVLGDGDGRFLAEFLRRTPGARALALDSSATMLHLLRRRCAFASTRLTTRHLDITHLPPDLDLSQTDLVATHFVLDCLPQAELDNLARLLAERLKPGTLWVISEFGLPQRQPWRALAAWYVRGLYLAFRVLTRLPASCLPDIPQALQDAGFERIHHADRLRGLLYSELWRLKATPKLPPRA